MVNHILSNENSALRSLFHKLEELKKLNSLFSQYADPELASHCEVVKFEKNCLFVIAENGSWATQLRFHIPGLMTRLRQHPSLEKLSGIICKTRPAFGKNQAASPRKRAVVKLKPQTAEKIRDSAKSIRDSRLRAILEKIAGQT